MVKLISWLIMQGEHTTEQRILEAAETVFLKDGFAGARMQQIADGAGINKAMLHYYFRSKDKLFELVLKHKMDQFVPQLTSSLQDDSLTFFDKIDRFVMLYLGMMQKNTRLPLFIITTMNRNPELMASFHLKFGREIVAVMQGEIEKGNINPVNPHQFLLTLMSMCIFPFLARPIFSTVFELTDEEYKRIIAERHVHVMQYTRAILAKPSSGELVNPIG